jgi:signal transduction histidine kinase/ligand-binding sensor domain-containing protein
MSIQNWAALLWGTLLAWAAQAQELHPDGQSFERRRWTQADGAPQHAVTVSQTGDGMLWFGAPTGLYSFDGMRFRKVQHVYGHELRSTNIMFTREIQGGLAVGYYFGGLSIFTPEKATHYVAGRDFPRGTAMGLALDKDGVPYAATSSGVATLRNGKWQAVGVASLPKGTAYEIVFDQAGRLWTRIGDNFYVRPPGSEAFVQVHAPAGARSVLRTDGLYAKPPGQDVQLLDVGPTARQDRLEQPQLYRDVPANGPHGTLWASRANDLVRLARGNDGVLRAAELFENGAGRDAFIIRTMQDREDNLWVLTTTGVERFRRHRFHRLETPPHVFHWLAQRGFGDELWIGASGGRMLRMTADGSRQTTEVTTPNTILRLTSDRVWVGAADALWEFRGDARQRWNLPERLGKGPEIQALAMDRQGRLLVAITGKGLWRFEEGKWQEDPRLHGMDDRTPISMLTDGSGKTWLGLTGGRLAEMTPDGASLLPAAAGLQVGNIVCLLDVGGRLLVGGDLGAAWIEGGKAYKLEPARADSFRRITGMVVDRQGSLWMHSDDGLYRIDAQALERFWQAPARPLEAELFGFEDGIGGMAAPSRPLPSLALAHDGRLYYATISEVGWLDPANISRNALAPTVILQSLRTPDREYLPADKLMLPQQTTTVDLSFTATALSIPERVRMKFRLSGVDQDWREAGPERRAQYTNLVPGSYRFQVIAANEDGVWNKEGAQLSFEIEPAFWQAGWFRAACALAALVAAALLYRWRVAVLQRRAEQHAALRLDAKLQERSRIARSLHDNLLQAVQALLLRFHLVEQKLEQQPELQKMVGSALDYAESLVASTRDEVMELRRPQDADELFATLRHTAAQAAPGAEQRLSFTVAGQPRYLRADSCAELSSALREAVLNSVIHSGARQIAVKLAFADDALLAEASDDGIGLDAGTARHGKEGHWGIPGMRERIARLGGQVEISAGPQGGVVVRLSIPALQAYA